MQRFTLLEIKNFVYSNYNLLKHHLIILKNSIIPAVQYFVFLQIVSINKKEDLFKTSDIYLDKFLELKSHYIDNNSKFLLELSLLYFVEIITNRKVYNISYTFNIFNIINRFLYNSKRFNLFYLNYTFNVRIIDISSDDILDLFNIKDIINFLQNFNLNKISNLTYYTTIQHFVTHNFSTINRINLTVIQYYNFFRSVIFALFITLLITMYVIFFFQINFIKQVTLWLMIGLLFFWLISGFNFFLKKYRFGKFTSAVIRFWKRTNAYFWIIEGFLFLLFFYYYLNSSQEPIYMYDYSSLNQTFLPNIINYYTILLSLLLICFFAYSWFLRFSSLTYSQHLPYILILTGYLVYLFLIESYQFYYTITLFNDFNWNINYETNLWTLEIDNIKLRIKQQYLVLALIAKYWHFLFIFISWLFFILKSFEQKRIYYTIAGLNIQNLIILFSLNVLFLVQWLKWITKRFFESIYYWFFTDSNNFSIKLFFSEILLYIQ